MSAAVLLTIFAVCFILGNWLGAPFGWWLFRRTHRNNPAALAFAARKGWPDESLSESYRRFFRS